MSVTESRKEAVASQSESLIDPAVHPRPKPTNPMFWRSPIRGPWLTSFLGTLLVPAITVIALTGFIDHWAQWAGTTG